MHNVVTMKFGSHLYGTQTPTSDLDYKGIFIPSAVDLLMQNDVRHYSKNTNNTGQANTQDDIDREFFSLKYFLEMAAQGQTVALDMLHAPSSVLVGESTAVWNFIQRNRSDFYTTDMSSYLDYVRRQASKYGVKGSRLAALKSVHEVVNAVRRTSIGTGTQLKVADIKHLLPVNEFCVFLVDEHQKSGCQEFYEVLGRKFQMTIKVEMMFKTLDALWAEYGERARKAAANEGIDWKAVSHALRAGYQLMEIYDTGDLVLPLQKADRIKAVKTGALPFNEVKDELEDLVSTIEKTVAVLERNGYRKTVDMTKWDEFVKDVHADIMKAYLK